MFRKATFYLILVLTLFVASCTAKESEINVNVNANSQQQPEKLVVYLSAIQHGFQSKNDSGEISVEYLYPSKHLPEFATKKGPRSPQSIPLKI